MDALQACALGASLLFGTCFQSIIGRPTFMEGSPASIEAFGEDGVEIMLWLSYSTMTLISVLCLSVIAYALQSRMELQNVLPSTQARLFFLCEVNPMNLVTALFTNALLLFVVLIVIGGLLCITDARLLHGHCRAHVHVSRQPAVERHAQRADQAAT